MVGIRRAFALLILGFYITQFAMTALLGGEEFFACYLALALCYGLAFFGLAAEWFWARWFAMGVGQFGSMLLLLVFKEEFNEIIAFFGFTHLAIAVLLLGDGMAARYEYSEHTAERWNFHEESLSLMRRAVKSAGWTLPLLILYALAPRPESHQLLALGLGAVGFFGLMRARTYGVLALGGAGLVALLDSFGAFGASAHGWLLLSPSGYPAVGGPVMVLLAAGLLLIPLSFAGPMLRFVRTPLQR